MVKSIYADWATENRKVILRSLANVGTQLVKTGKSLVSQLRVGVTNGKLTFGRIYAQAQLLGSSLKNRKIGQNSRLMVT